MTSIVTTGGAAYYFVSDGGDPKKFEAKMRDARLKINETVANLDIRRIWPPAASSGKAVDNVAESVSAVADDGPQAGTGQLEERGPRAMQQERQPGAFCHTCSGPRIWFFAEKFRLKRRITPHPDPPRD